MAQHRNCNWITPSKRFQRVHSAIRLVAALAITLGQMTSSPVVDDNAMWFPLRAQAAEARLSVIANSDPQTDFETAVLNVYARLEVAKAV